MKANVKDPTSSLERAIDALRSDEPSPQNVAESRARVQSRLFGVNEAPSEHEPIRGCDDVQSLLAAYHRGGLRAPRALLVRNHLVECASCRDVYARRGALRLATTPWQRASESKPTPRVQKGRALWMLAAAIACGVALLVVRSLLFGTATEQYASVQAVSGALYRVDGAAAVRLMPGARLSAGQVVRAGASPQSLLRLADGSMVELGERAEFSIAVRGKDTTLQLNRGQIIVQAAKRKSGHLYVATHDCRVAVTGTVFSVLSSLKGSRVSVIEGEVHVAQPLGNESVLHRGDQVTTSQALARVPIEQEVGWSRNLDEHLALLRAMTQLGKDWAEVRAPELRYESRLLALVPDNTVVYAALPNYGGVFAEGYRLLQSRLAQSAILSKWWEDGDLGKDGILNDSLVSRMHELSTFLGDEMVIASSLDTDEPSLMVLAELKKPGLRERLGSELPSPDGTRIPLTVVDEQAAIAGAASAGSDGIVLLLTPRIAALSTSPAAIAEVATRLGSGDESAFASSLLGERVSQAYQRGAGLLVAADLEMISAYGGCATCDNLDKNSRHLLFERKNVTGQALNTGELAFAGPRSGVASWLAEPAPMGSLDFFTSRASVVAAFVVKRPTEVLDDILRFLPSGNEALAKLSRLESDWDLRIREDFAQALGTEIAIALDGPLLPQPAWKLVVEVEDAVLLERGLEILVRRVDEELRKAGECSLVFEHEQVGPHTYHRIRAKDASIPFEANCAFIDGYLVMTPTRALLSRAIEAHFKGESLARSARFTTLLPRDGHDSVSGLVFQDLLSVVAAALDSADLPLSAGQKEELEKLHGESKPSLVSFYARVDRIEMAGTGDLFPIGPEALALPGLMSHTFPGAFSAAWK